MRCFTMQSPVVWEIVKRDKVYYADLSKCRARSDYEKDIKQLNGRVPIWCYVPNGTGMTYDNMKDCTELFECHCQMSQVKQRGCWDSYVMIEIEVPDERLKVGLTHNACDKCMVFDCLTLDMVKAVYKVTDCDDRKLSWYYKNIIPIEILADNCVFPSPFYGAKENKKELSV